MDTTLHVLLWIAQGLLALFFFAGGAPKVLGRGIDAWVGFCDLPRAEVILIGVTEVLAAAGLVLPEASGTLPWLTPLAAIGLTVIGLMAAGFHARANEWLNILETSLLACIAGVIAIGRWHLITSSTDIPAWTLIVALCLLLPAAIINVTVLLRRQQAAQPHSRSAPVDGTPQLVG